MDLRGYSAGAAHPFRLPLGSLRLGGGSKSVEVQVVWEVYDDQLQFMARLDALSLDESLDAGDVSRAWLVWSSAAETALADAYRFAGGPVPERGLVMGRGTARMRTVCSGGPLRCPVRRNAADTQEGGDVPSIVIHLMHLCLTLGVEPVSSGSTALRNPPQPRPCRVLQECPTHPIPNFLTRSR